MSSCKYMANSNYKNHSLEGLRFIFMTLICLWHFQGKDGILSRGYLAVEFFFILSGILLYKSYNKTLPLSPLDYTYRKFRRFVPKYWGGLLIAFTIRSLLLYILHKDYSAIIKDLFRLIPESLMLQNIGFYQGGVNTPLWYLCVLVVGGGILYSFLFYYKDKALNLFLPVLIICGYTYIKYFSHDSLENWDIEGFIYLPLFRGFIDMGLGVFIGFILKERQEFFSRNVRTFNILSVVSFVLVIVMHFTSIPTDTYSLIFFSVLLMGSLIKNSLIEKLFHNKLWLSLGNITFSMLVLHMSIVPLVRRLPIHKNNYGLSLCIYLIILIVCSFLFDHFFNKIMSKRSLKNVK